MGKIKGNYELIIEYFKNCKSTVKTAIKFGYTIGGIINILKNNDIPTPKRGETCRKYTCNENYFKKIDSEEKAYWLGFLYADGCIIDRKKNGQKRLGLALKYSDKDHIENFNKAIENNHPVKTYTLKSGKFIGKMISSTYIASDKLTEDLINLGCTPRKSLTLKFPINKISNKYIKDFIRGYFDGDGSVFISNEKHWRNKKIFEVIHFRFFGTKEFLEDINTILNLNGKVKQVKNSKIYELPFKRNLKALKFFDYLYKDSQIFLKRKKLIFDKHFNKLQGCSETIINHLEQMNG